MARLILHLDLDAFFVSCERIKNPKLVGQPVIVGAKTRRGVVSSASYEARACGVYSAMPVGQAAKLCPKAVFLRPDFAFYSETSGRVFQFLREQSPAVEQASIDEFYLDWSAHSGSRAAVLKEALRLKLHLIEKFHLPSTVGVAANKLVSKIACRLAKPDGCLYVEPGREAAFLKPRDIRMMPGIGPRTEEVLKKRGIRTLGDLARCSQAELHRLLGKTGLWLWEGARGIDDSPIVVEEPPPKSIGEEETFDYDVNDPRRLREVIRQLSQDCVERLTVQGVWAKTVTLKVRYADFETHDYSCTISPTDQEPVIFDAARALFQRHYQSSRKVRLLGVRLSRFVSPSSANESLFPAQNGR